MSNIRDELLNRMIKLYGFENALVIQFAQYCEAWDNIEWNDTILKMLVEAHEHEPQRIEVE